MAESSWPKGVKLLQLPQRLDERGALTFLEETVHIPFPVKRVFWITDVPSGQTRGGHAHRTCHEAIFAVSGQFEIEVSDGVITRIVTIDRPSEGILIPAGVWCELRRFHPGTVCVVMASQEYDATGYIHNHALWLAEAERLNKL